MCCNDNIHAKGNLVRSKKKSHCLDLNGYHFARISRDCDCLGLEYVS